MDPTLRQTLRLHLRTQIRYDWRDANPRLKRVLFALILGCLPILGGELGVVDRLEPKLAGYWFSVRGPHHAAQATKMAHQNERAKAPTNVSTGPMSATVHAASLKSLHFPMDDSFLGAYYWQPVAGVEIPATLSTSLGNENWIRRLPQRTEALTMALATIAAAYFILAARPLAAFLLAPAFAAIWLAVSYFAFSSLHYFVPGFTFLAALMLVVQVRWAGWLAYADGPRTYSVDWSL